MVVVVLAEGRGAQDQVIGAEPVHPLPTVLVVEAVLVILVVNVLVLLDTSNTSKTYQRKS